MLNNGCVDNIATGYENILNVKLGKNRRTARYTSKSFTEKSSAWKQQYLSQDTQVIRICFSA